MTPVAATEAHVWLGKINLAMVRTNQAREHIEAALHREPNNLGALVLRGQYHIFRNEYEEALASIETARALDPSLADVYPNLSTCYRELGRREEAVEYARKGVELLPAKAHAHFALALALGATGRIADSLREAAATIRLAPDHLPAYLYAGEINRKAGQTDVVIELYEAGVRLNPWFQPLRETLVEVYIERDDYEHALHHALEVALRDGAPRTLNVAGYCARLANQAGVAESAFRSAIVRNPENWLSCFLLGDLYLDAGDYARAEPALRRSAELNPQAWQPRNALGTLLMRSGRAAEGEQVLRQAMELAPSAPAPPLQLARRFAATGRKTEAMILAYKAFEHAGPDVDLREEASRLLRALSDGTETVH